MTARRTFAGRPGPVHTRKSQDQLAARLAKAWPHSSKLDLNPDLLKDAFLKGMLSGVTGAVLLSAQEQRVASRERGTSYVGIRIAIGYDEAEERPLISQVLEGGPADRAGACDDDRIEEVDGVSTPGHLPRRGQRSASRGQREPTS